MKIRNILETKKFDESAPVAAFVGAGGEILMCGTCLKSRNLEGTEVSPMSTMNNCVEMVEWADKILSF